MGEKLRQEVSVDGERRAEEQLEHRGCLIYKISKLLMTNGQEP